MKGNISNYIQEITLEDRVIELIIPYITTINTFHRDNASTTRTI
jgi:hypothetical protein